MLLICGSLTQLDCFSAASWSSRRGRPQRAMRHSSCKSLAFEALALDLLGDALVARGELLGVLGHHLADFFQRKSARAAFQRKDRCRKQGGIWSTSS